MRALGHLSTGSRIAVLRTSQRARILQRLSVRLHGKSRTKSQASSDLDALCWYIGHKMLAELPSDHVQ